MVLRVRDAIAAFYRARPPRDHMRAEHISTTGDDTTVVRLGWQTAGGGELTARWKDGAVVSARLVPVS